MNRYSKTKLRQGQLPRQPRAPVKPEPAPAPRRGLSHEEQALLFELPADEVRKPAPPPGP